MLKLRKAAFEAQYMGYLPPGTYARPEVMTTMKLGLPLRL